MPVPGGTFNRRNDATLPAKISAFELDVFEVTVGRFRAFVESGAATQAHAPTAGTGAHPKLPGSGWHDEWDLRLPQDISQLTSSLNGGKSTWTDAAGANEHLPINNVQWLQAFAFCAWDGGRLPTLAELSFAATGGDEQRMFPWGSTIPSPSTAAVQAAFNCNFKLPVRTCGTTCSGCDFTDIAPVGSLPDGVGKFGQLDLAGNVTELTLDLADPPDEARPPPVCDDCAVVLTTDPDKAIIGTKQFTAQFFSLGGSWDGSGGFLQSSSYTHRKYDERQDSAGFRCARDARVLP
jgi:formylglycine-generating enzyme required for sulfatase activity